MDSRLLNWAKTKLPSVKDYVDGDTYHIPVLATGVLRETDESVNYGPSKLIFRRIVIDRRPEWVFESVNVELGEYDIKPVFQRFEDIPIKIVSDKKDV